MDKIKLRNYQIISAIFVAILGTLLHFTYAISGENSLVAIFSAVNESVWEHLKLLFFPMLLSTIIGYFFVGEKSSRFICAKTIGIIFSLAFIIIFFYTYTGILGKSVVFIDIASFFVAVALGEYLAYQYMFCKKECNDKKAILILIVFLLSFICFTFWTPQIGLFKDPITNQYGITKNKEK